jgi:ubiquinone biosynthesis protein COQ9
MHLTIICQTSWYTRRASLAAIYAAAGALHFIGMINSRIPNVDLIPELHQLTSPQTAYHFLDSLLDASSALKSSLDEAELFTTYIVKGWAGIIKSKNIF